MILALIYIQTTQPLWWCKEALKQVFNVYSKHVIWAKLYKGAQCKKSCKTCLTRWCRWDAQKPMRVLSQGTPNRSYALRLITIYKQRLGHDGVRRPGDLLLGSLFLRGQNVFQGVTNEESYMLLIGAVAPGHFFAWSLGQSCTLTQTWCKVFLGKRELV